MSCDPSIQLANIKEGDSWSGLTHTCSSTGTAFADTLADVTMVFKTPAGVAGLTLTNDTDITIDDATAWSFTVEPILEFPLAVGLWLWSITCTDSAGVIKTRMSGTKRVTER